MVFVFVVPPSVDRVGGDGGPLVSAEVADHADLQHNDIGPHCVVNQLLGWSVSGKAARGEAGCDKEGGW